ncbi:MAG: GNAT family N-acetyltransferase [Candidatus Rokubacteria bacterium]|nr:GNAT family N-acetyltransferase [Candidatus Rokubacteria bacterium]
MPRNMVTVRPIESADLDAIVAIDEKLTGQTRKDYWRLRLEIAACRPPWMSSVAEMDARVVGFLFAWVGEAEFGIATPTGWIDLIGVDPAYRGRGVGNALVDRFIAGGRDLRAIGKVATLIDIGQADVREFFTRLGFQHGPMIHLERNVSA